MKEQLDRWLDHWVDQGLCGFTIVGEKIGVVLALCLRTGLAIIFTPFALFHILFERLGNDD